MSNREKLNKIKEIIRQLVVKELDEVSTTGTAGTYPGGPGHYFTPYAFSGGRKKDKKKKKKITHAGGYKPVNEKMRPAVKKMLKQKGYGPIFQAIDNSKRQFKQMKYSRGEIQDTLIDMFGKEDPKILQKINEGRYHDWRNDESMTPKQKIGRSMREIRDALNELDKTVKMNLKLKTELKMKSEDYWKNTHKALTKISERLVKMANKVGNLK